LKIPDFQTQENTLLVGFPSNGLVGIFSISYLIHFLKMEPSEEIELIDLPPVLFVENGEIIGPIRAYHKNNLFAIISDAPFDDYLAEEFAFVIQKFCIKNAIKRVICVSGMESTNPSFTSTQVYGLATHSSLESILYRNQIPKFLEGSIFGPDAAFISVLRKSDIPLLVLYSECHPFFPDPMAAINSLTMLSKILKIKINTRDIETKMDAIRIQYRHLMEDTMQTIQPQLKTQFKTPQIYN
jgi:uncharacterized protein